MAVDYAHAIQNLVDVQYPHALKIMLVQDNLNTHKPASLYEAFPPKEAPTPDREAGDPLHPQAR